jgi:hypothetical protein
MERGEMPATEAAVVLEVSLRQVCLLLVAYRRGEDLSPCAFLTQVTQRQEACALARNWRPGR